MGIERNVNTSLHKPILSPRIGRQSDPKPITEPPVTQVRGILAERVVISTALDPFLSLRALASYSGLSVRKLRDLLTDPAHPMPHYRIGGKIVVRRSEYDAWATQFRTMGNPNLEQLVVDVLADLGDPKPGNRA